jgi:uncharacterized membrane-anchored protein YjiN (DUF445 family)
MLVVSALFFCLCKWMEGQSSAFEVLRAGFEGALVGGIADWFAVTALFRHPFGLKIPHTALIATRKDEIGKQLAKFVRVHFANARVLRRKWVDYNPIERTIGVFLCSDRPERFAGWVLKQALTLIKGRIPSLDIDQTAIEALKLIREFKSGERLHKALSTSIGGSEREKIIDASTVWLDQLIRDHGSSMSILLIDEIKASGNLMLAEIIRRNWTQIERMVFVKLNQIRIDPEFHLRKKLDVFLANAIQDRSIFIHFESALLNRLDEWFQSDEMKDWVNHYGRKMCSMFLNDLESSLPVYQEKLSKAFRKEMERLASDPAQAQHLERIILHWLLVNVRRYGGLVEHLIRDEVSRWDPNETSALIESQIGTDLQWIRINGALVGFFAGSSIQILTMVFQRVVS